MSDEVLKPAEPPLVLCPLDFERRAVVRFAKLPVKTIGPGPDAVRHAFAERAQWPVTNPRLILLVGVAGGLNPLLPRGTAYAPTSVVGCTARPTLLSTVLATAPTTLPTTLQRDHTTPPLAITETNAPVHDPDAKARLFRERAADLVDTESLAFATCADAANIPWAIVRGVGDAADDALPREVTGFVDATGATKITRVLRSLLRRPSLIGELRTLARSSRKALQNAAFLADAFGALPAISLCTPERPFLLYGGSFDPPHARHATMLRDAMRALGAPVATVMPAALNPLKLDHPPAHREARVAMCRAAFADHGDETSAQPRTVALTGVGGEIRLSSLELDRPGPSFTIDTVHAMLASYPHLAGAITFLVGSDAIRHIERWHRWRELLELARPAVVVRPPDDHATVRAFLRDFGAKHGLSKGFADAESWLLPLEPVDLSSTDVRAAIARGERPAGLADGVWREITTHGLYGFGSVR